MSISLEMNAVANDAGLAYNNKMKSALKLIYQLLIGICVFGGLFLICLSYFFSENISKVLNGIGLSLLPTGIVTLLLAYFASRMTEEILVDRIDLCLHKSLSNAIDDVKFKVNTSIQSIDRNVEAGLKNVNFNIKNCAPVFLSCTQLGVQSVHINRGDALEKFNWYLDAEINKANMNESAKIWIISSSITGIIRTEGKYFHGKKFIERISKSNCDFRIIMTDPAFADVRAQQEGRADGEIPHEITGNLALLKRNGIKNESIKYYPGTPTVFAIATSDHMLLNPYPYETEAFRCFSLIIYKSTNGEDIYQQYMEYHFEKSWNRARMLTPNEWNLLN